MLTSNGPLIPFALAVVYLLLIIILTILIDFHKVYIPVISDWVNLYPAAIFWLQINREAGLTENLQWLFLFISFCAALAVIYLQRGSWTLERLGVLFLSIGLAIMFLEDVFNVRHALSWYISSFFYDGLVGSYEWRTSAFRSVIEIAFYAFLGSIMVAAFYFLYFRSKISSRTRILLIGGYLIYGVASFASATRNIGDWYAKLGKAILDPLLKNRNVSWDADSIIFFSDPVSFWFMDLLVEESLELLGSALLLSAILSVLAQTLSNTVNDAVQSLPWPAVTGALFVFI